MPDERYIGTDLGGDETLTEYRHRRFLARRDRHDDHTPICAAPDCPHLAVESAYCALHGPDAR